jgi:hypothetical protein
MGESRKTNCGQNAIDGPDLTCGSLLLFLFLLGLDLLSCSWHKTMTKLPDITTNEI